MGSDSRKYKTYNVYVALEEKGAADTEYAFENKTAVDTR
jgi:hypothetical protein